MLVQRWAHFNTLIRIANVRIMFIEYVFYVGCHLVTRAGREPQVVLYLHCHAIHIQLSATFLGKFMKSIFLSLFYFVENNNL